MRTPRRTGLGQFDGVMSTLDTAGWNRASYFDSLIKENGSIGPELFSRAWENAGDWAVRQSYGFTTVAFILVTECLQQ